VSASAKPSFVDDDDPFEQQAIGVGGADRTSPYPVFARLRAEGPVHAGLPEMGVPPAAEGESPLFTVYSYEAVSALLADSETFSSSAYGDVIGVVIGRTLLEMDEPDHRAYRLTLQQAFSRTSMKRWEEETVRPLISDAVDALIDAGSAELVRELCLPYPLRVIGSILGLPPEDHEQFHRLAIEMIALSVDFDRAGRAADALREYFAGILELRRADPRDDMISVLASAETDGLRLSDDDIFAFLRLLLPAGAETAYRSSSSLLYALLSDTEQLQALRDDRSLIPRAVDETIRWEPPLLYVPRTATKTVEVFGTTVPAGATVTCNLGAANRDPERFQNPDCFEARRSDGGHLGFGFGAHTCLGMHLARMETAALIDTMLDRLPGLRLDPDAEAPNMTGTIMRSADRLDVVW
jgi:cytochrome P450